MTSRPRHLTIVFAMEAEWTPWRQRHAFTPLDSGSGHDSDAGPLDRGGRDAGRADGAGRPVAPDTPTYQARIAATDVRVLVCGIGPARAAACAAAALTPPIDALIVGGFAGGLRPALRSSDLVVPRLSRTESADDPPVPCDAALIARALRAGAHDVDTLLTVDRPITTVAEKARLGRLHDIVDMEGHPLVAAAAARGVPALVLRVISDAADEELPPELLRAMNPDGSIAPRRFLTAALVRPWRWPALWRLVGTHGTARLRLADLLDRFVADAADEPDAS